MGLTILPAPESKRPEDPDDPHVCAFLDAVARILADAFLRELAREKPEASA